ncbi:hypothetical protein [Haloferula sp. BvORR071]|uniref:hypothetical protein n=1 Tax=Haloferula sp. BvORR071 TaxID=1396141 RepID=UPI00069608E1|nr:hypothetical protein [Haloferula sp. BvORR071]
MKALAVLFVCLSSLALAEIQSPVPEKLRQDFKLDPFYAKCVMVGDFPIVASAKVNDAALTEAEVIVKSMLAGREDILTAMAKNKVRLTVMATSERTCDAPEHSDLTPKEYWNRRARGLGATTARPSVSCGEENLLNCPGDPYSTENIMVHEFGHAIHQMGVNSIDKTFDRRLKETYEAAMKAGKWKNGYAAENYYEYWAEAVQSWFGTNRENDSIHNHVNTRAELLEYDPGVAKLCAEVFPNNDWTYRRADDPARKDEPHLKGLDRSKLPKFEWSEAEKKADKKD